MPRVSTTPIDSGRQADAPWAAGRPTRSEVHASPALRETARQPPEDAMTPLKRLVLVAAALLAGWPTAAHGQCTGCKFPATGQMTCWDSSGNVIPCAGTGQDGDLRKGAPLSYTDNGNGTVTDNNTGLVWEKLSRDGSVHDVSNTYTWANAFAQHAATLNSTTFAGHTNCRMPNVKELEGIMNYQNVDPTVSPAFNTNCTSGCTVLRSEERRVGKECRCGCAQGEEE